MGVRVRQKKKGEWWVFVSYHGKRTSQKVGTKAKAEKLAEELQYELARKKDGFFKNEELPCPTLKQYIKGWEDKNGAHPGWSATAGKYSLKSSTRSGYGHIIENHLIPEFGSRPVDQITSRHIADFIYKLFDNGLRSSTVRNIKNCLSSILRNANIPDGYIDINPARGVPITPPEDEKPKREPSPFTWKEKTHFEKVFSEKYPRHYPLVICGFRTGLRIGELLGLKWGDIDFYHRLIYVQRNITRNKITTPKSKSSVRAVRMTSQLVTVLKSHRKRVKEEKLKKAWPDVPEWIFCNETGGFINYGNFVHRVWNKAMEKSELQKRTPHDMRHTYATLRLSKGDSLSEVSKEMGHGTPNITFTTYYKWLPKESTSNIDELDGDEKGLHPNAPYMHPGNKKGVNDFS